MKASPTLSGARHQSRLAVGNSQYDCFVGQFQLQDNSFCVAICTIFWSASCATTKMQVEMSDGGELSPHILRFNRVLNRALESRQSFLRHVGRPRYSSMKGCRSCDKIANSLRNVGDLVVDVIERRLCKDKRRSFQLVQVKANEC